MAQKLKTQPKKVKNWFLNKTQAIRRVSKPMATRMKKSGGQVGVILVFLLILGSFLYPSGQSQKLKKQLLSSPHNFQAHLQLADIFLKNHQFKEAEKVLLLAEQIKGNKTQSLKTDTELSLEKLWQKKHLSDPQDIQKLIFLWEEIVKEKKDYRDGYLQLAVLYYKISEKEKAQMFLEKALLVDPNFPPTQELKKFF